jgi:OOP family OmpA-OmpF porin
LEDGDGAEEEAGGGFQKSSAKSRAEISLAEERLLSELDEYFKDPPNPEAGKAENRADSPEDPFSAHEEGDPFSGKEGESPFMEEGGEGDGLSDPALTDPAGEGPPPEEELPPPPDPDSELGQLRSLLLERELKQLNRLHSAVGDPQALAGTVSQVVTEALMLRSHRDDKLNTVLAPTVEKIVSASVRRNPEALANQIFPVIGPAIRKSISDSFSSMLQSFNNTLEMSLSLKGLKWRLEALRVHKPFSEIVLLHTLVYHVEEIYLIHADSGLILDHLLAEGGESRDAELVAAMFTAIRDFIRDSFSVGQKENLDNLRFGERTIYLLRSDEVFMAAVVRGNPPASLTTELQEALELMVVDAAEDLSVFKGDAKPFKRYRGFFEPFLVARYQDQKRLPFLVRKAPLFAVLLVLIFLGSLWLGNREEERRAAGEAQRREERIRLRDDSLKIRENLIASSLDAVNNIPGLAVGSVTKLPDGKLEIVCLKDELAPDPTEALTRNGGLNRDGFQLVIKPFVSMDPPIVIRRVREAIPLPPGVKMDYEEESGRLALTGEANLGWIMETRERALTIAGVRSLDFSGLTDPRTSRMQELVNEINGVVIHFPLNKADPVPEDQAKLDAAVDNLAALEKLCSEMQIGVSLIIYGHADAIGQARRNYQLSMERSHTVAALLYAKGSYMPIRNYGLGSRVSEAEDDPEAESRENPDMRRIELRVLVGAENAGPASSIARDAPK